MLSYVDPSTGAGPGHLPAWLTDATERAPLYRRLPAGGGPPHIHTASDLLDAGDPYGGRRDPGVAVSTFMQMAATLPLFWALRSSDLTRMGDALAATWHHIGIESGTAVALYDYATSPTVAFASGAFLPYLGSGAADLLGCTVVCNDGLPEMAGRCAHLLDYVWPSTLFVAGENVEPLIAAVGADTPRPARIVIVDDDVVRPPEQLGSWGDRLGASVQQLWRCDPALFFAPACPRLPGVFHPPPHFLVESVDLTPDGPADALCVTNLVVTASVVVRYFTAQTGRIHDGPCVCGGRWAGVEVDGA